MTLVVICSTCATAAEKLTYADLINRLTDLEQLAVLPVPGENCAQASSYDRASKYDKKKNTYIDWSANADGGQFIRMEDDEFVFAELEGPGVIWRVWSALPGAGHVKIYLDGQDEPTIDMPFAHYFDGQHPPFNYNNLSYFLPASRTEGGGANLYFPIPYAKSCKITAQQLWGGYYHFTYTTFPKDTVVPTFKAELTGAEKAALSKVNKTLGSCGSDPAGKRKNQITEQQTIKIAPNQTTLITQLKGPHAITALKVNMNLPASPADRDILRELVLSIHWDGQSKPAVWSPLGDFFATAPGANKFKSLPMGITDNGFYSYWYMPFKKKALLKLTNSGSKGREVTFTITHAPLSKPIDTLGRFHAKWHRDAFLPKDPARNEIDWTLLKTQGQGRFCGTVLNIWDPRGGWWGEGDEKFFVDGEKFPSTFGTGSEDYFGYAWGDPTLFSKAFHSQTINTGNNNSGHISVNRFQIADNIPFQKSFEGAIEKYESNRRQTFYDSTVYWYQAAGQADPYKPIPLDQRLGYYLPADPKPVP